MKKYDITKIVQEEVLAKLDEYITATSSIPIQKPSKIAPLPGAPFGGNLSLVINNQARAALKQWARLCKAAQSKFGEPGDWPQSIVNVAQKLGGKVEQLVSTDTAVNEADDVSPRKKPSDQAKELGLSYGGYGYWIDPKTGQRVAKTVDGNLVRIDGDISNKEPEAQKVSQAPEADQPSNSDTNAPISDVSEFEVKLAELLKGIKMPGEESDITDPQLLKNVMKTFKTAGRWVPQSQDTGSTAIKPGWNKAYEDIPFDANGEETVQKLLQMVGDPMRLLRWLMKTFQKETPNGKQRIMQYISILKGMGVLDQEDMQDAGKV